MKAISTICISLLLSSTALYCQAQSLEQAVASALESNPRIRAAFNRFKATEQQITQARAGYMPSVNLTAGAGQEWTTTPALRTVGDTPVDLTRSGAGINLRQLLFSGFETQSEVARTTAATESERFTLLAEAENLALEVSVAYLNALEAEQIVLLSDNNLQTHLDIQKQIRQRTQSGLGSTSDLSQINARVALARANLIAAKNNQADAQTQFLRLVDQLPDGLVTPVPDETMLPQSAEEAFAYGRDANPTILSARKDIDAAAAQYESSKSRYFPELAIELGANTGDNLGGIPGNANDATAMLRLNYNLFSGGRDRARVKESAYQINEAKEINERTQRQLRESVNLAWNARTLIEEQLVYLRDHVESAHATREAYQKQFQLNRRTLLDLLDTENELFDARRAYVAAESDYLQSQYRLLNASGRLLSSLRVNTPGNWSNP